MSYFCDHLAWQQRVVQEFKASQNFYEHILVNDVRPITSKSNYHELINILQSGGKTISDIRKTTHGNLMNRSFVAPGTVPALDQKGQSNDLNVSAVVTKKDLLRERSSNMRGNNNSNQQQQQQQFLTYQYAPKSKMMGQTIKVSQGRNRYKSTYSRQNQQQVNHNQLNTMPEKVVTAAVNIENQDDLQPRFNEEFEVKSFKRGPKSIFSQKSKTQAQSVRPQSTANSRSHFKKIVQVQSKLVDKKKILEAIEKLNERDLEKVSKILKVEENNEKERLLQEQEELEVQDELRDKVDQELKDENIQVELEKTTNYQDDVQSRVSKYSRYSHMPKSEISRLSSKTYIQHLETELNEEKEARKKLEREMEELKKISQEVLSQIQTSKKQDASKRL